MVPPRLKGGCAASSSTTGKTTKHFWHPKPLSPPSHPCHDTMATALTPKSPRALRTGGTHLSLHGGGRAWGPSRSLRGSGGGLGGAARLPLSPPRGLRGMAAASSASRSGRRPLEAGCLSQAGRSPGRTGARHVGEAEPPPPS